MLYKTDKPSTHTQITETLEAIKANLKNMEQIIDLSYSDQEQYLNDNAADYSELNHNEQLIYDNWTEQREDLYKRLQNCLKSIS